MDQLSEKHAGGRPPNEIQYTTVTYNGRGYVVGAIQHNGSVIHTVFDAEDYQKVSNYPSWHVTATSYISTTVRHDGKRKALYLHNLIMGILTFNGKGQTTSVDHISRNGFDNRKENLRIVSQTEQNLNQRQKPRHIELPADCGVGIDEVPKHIWYVKAHGLHGDRFAIEFKSENLVWRSTSSKVVPTRQKLEQAINKLHELYAAYPHLNPDNPGIVGQREALEYSYDAIIALT